MREGAMKNLMAFSLYVAVCVGLGCSGFSSGFKHALTGQHVEEAEKSKPGFDWGTIAANLMIAVTGYLARVGQDKLIPPKPVAPAPSPEVKP